MAGGGGGRRREGQAHEVAAAVEGSPCLPPMVKPRVFVWQGGYGGNCMGLGYVERVLSHTHEHFVALSLSRALSRSVMLMSAWASYRL